MTCSILSSRCFRLCSLDRCSVFQWLHVQSLDARGVDFFHKLEAWHVGRVFGAWLTHHRRKRWRRQRVHLILQAVRSLWQKNAFMAWQHYTLAVRNQRREFVLARVLYAWKLLAKQERDRRKEAAVDEQIMQQVEREREMHRNPMASQMLHSQSQFQPPPPPARSSPRLPFIDDSDESSFAAPFVLVPSATPSTDSAAASYSPASSRPAPLAGLGLGLGLGLGSSRTPRGSALSPADLDDDAARTLDQVGGADNARRGRQSPRHSPAGRSFRGSASSSSSIAAAAMSPIAALLSSPFAMPLPLMQSLRSLPADSADQQWRFTPFRQSAVNGNGGGVGNITALQQSVLADKLPPAQPSPEALLAMSSNGARSSRPTAGDRVSVSPVRPVPVAAAAASMRAFMSSSSASSSGFSPSSRPSSSLLSPSRRRFHSSGETPSPSMSRSRQRQDEMEAERLKQQQQRLVSPATAAFVRKLFAD